MTQIVNHQLCCVQVIWQVVTLGVKVLIVSALELPHICFNFNSRIHQKLMLSVFGFTKLLSSWVDFMLGTYWTEIANVHHEISNIFCLMVCVESKAVKSTGSIRAMLALENLSALANQVCSLHYVTFFCQYHSRNGCFLPSTRKTRDFFCLLYLAASYC